MYPGNGTGGFGTPVEVQSPSGKDWSRTTQLAVGSAGQLLAREGDRLLVYVLNADSSGIRVGSPGVLAEHGWAHRTLALSDTLDEGSAAFWARDDVRGTLEFYSATYDPSGQTPPVLGAPTAVAASGWSAWQRPSFASVGDLTGDLRTDLVATTREGALQSLAADDAGALGGPVTLERQGGRGLRLF